MTRPSARSGFSRLGLGITGPHASPALRRDATIQLVRAALNQGVTLFDTGPAYGDGEGEKRLGYALADLRGRAEMRDGVFICTKAGIHPGKRRDFSPGAIEASLEDSLKRLGMNYIDALLLHGAAPEDLTDALIARLEGFLGDGRVRHLGACGRGPELDPVIESGRFDLLMAPCNTLTPKPDLERLQRAKAAGMDIIAIEIMAPAAPRHFPPRNASDFWYLARAAKSALRGQAPVKTVKTTPQDALRQVLDRPEIACALTLTTRPAHLAENARIALMDPPLDPEPASA